MNLNIMLVSDVESVYLINGKFFEGDKISASSDSVVYLTVLPLCAEFSPYTVKLIGNIVAANKPLAFFCKLSEREYALKLGKRYGFIYSDGHKNEPTDIVERLLYYVKGGHFNFAAEIMSESLAQSVDEAALIDFFAEYSDVIKLRDRYYAVDNAGIGHALAVELVGGRIDNISIE